MLLLLARWKHAARSIEAARVTAPPGQVFRYVTLPFLTPA